MKSNNEKAKVKKLIILIFILSFVSLFGWQIYKKAFKSRNDSARKGRAAAVAVEIKPVEKALMRDVGQFTGSLLPRSQFIVAPKVSGRLEKLLVNIGDHIKNGRLIAVLDDDEHVQQVEQARAELDVARANLEQSRRSLELAERELERAKALLQQGIISQSDIDAQEAKYSAEVAGHKVATAQAEQKGALLKAAQVRLSYTKIYVKWEDGSEYRTIGERFVDEGTMLQANAPIVSVLDIGYLKGVIFATEKEYFRIKVGQDVTVNSDAFLDKTFSGKVVRIAPLLKEASREARVEIEIPNRGGLLKPGMFVSAQIEFARRDNATVIPLSSIVKRNETEGVFVADLNEMKARFAPVKLGIKSSEFAEVVEPTISGWVVILGQHLLNDGSPILPPEKKPAAPLKEKPEEQNKE